MEKIIDENKQGESLALEQKEALYAQVAYGSFKKEQLYFTQRELEKEISQ